MAWCKHDPYYEPFTNEKSRLGYGSYAVVRCHKCPATASAWGGNWPTLPAWWFSEPEPEKPTYVERMPWDEYFKNIAKAVSLRADCRRAKHGAVIVKDNRIVSTGYNGAPAGSAKSCILGHCPRGLKSEAELAHLAGDYADCIACHAEQNAIAYANHSDTVGATIYITGKPCPMCEKLIQAAGISKVVY